MFRKCKASPIVYDWIWTKTAAAWWIDQRFIIELGVRNFLQKNEDELLAFKSQVEAAEAAKTVDPEDVYDIPAKVEEEEVEGVELEEKPKLKKSLVLVQNDGIYGIKFDSDESDPLQHLREYSGTIGGGRCRVYDANTGFIVASAMYSDEFGFDYCEFDPAESIAPDHFLD